MLNKKICRKCSDEKPPWIPVDFEGNWRRGGVECPCLVNIYVADFFSTDWVDRDGDCPPNCHYRMEQSVMNQKKING